MQGHWNIVSQHGQPRRRIRVLQKTGKVGGVGMVSYYEADFPTFPY